MEQPREATAAEEAIALFDACWFHRLVLLSCPPPTPAPASPPPPQWEQQQQPELQAPVESKSSELQRAPSVLRHRRSRSDEAAAAAFEALEPLKIPNSHRARLETILSGKDGLASPQPLPERRRPEVRRPGGRRRRRRGRSMSELEFEEVKGLRDLGFTFSDAEVDAELASIVPGLRRRRSEEEAKKAVVAASAEEEARSDSAAASASAPRRPYLSEAWEDEEEDVRRMLRNLRIPAARDGADLKEHIRLWAHTVASGVR